MSQSDNVACMCNHYGISFGRHLSPGMEFRQLSCVTGRVDFLGAKGIILIPVQQTTIIQCHPWHSIIRPLGCRHVMHLLQSYDTIIRPLKILLNHFGECQYHDQLWIRQRGWNNRTRCGLHGHFYRSKPNILYVNSRYEFSLPDAYSLC